MSCYIFSLAMVVLFRDRQLHLEFRGVLSHGVSLACFQCTKTWGPSTVTPCSRTAPPLELFVGTLSHKNNYDWQALEKPRRKIRFT